MEETPVCTRSDLIDDIGFQIHVKGTGYMLAGGSLREESAETIIVMRRRPIDETTIGLVKGYQNLLSTRQHDATYAQTVLDGV